MPSSAANGLATGHTHNRVRGGRCFMGIEEHVAVRCCDATDVDTRHAGICPRDCAQVNQHQPLLHSISRTLKRLRVLHQVQSGEPFTADRNLRMDIVVGGGGLRNAPNPEYRDKSIMVDVTHADPQTQVHVRAGSAGHDGSAASTSRRASTDTMRSGHVSFDERSRKLATFAVESFGRLGVEGSYFIDQLAASVVGGRDGGSMARKGVLKERILQMVSVTTQVAIPRQVSRFKLHCNRFEIAKMQEGVDGEGMIDPHQWRGGGVWTGSSLEGMVCNKNERWN